MNEIETLEKQEGESALHFAWYHTFLMLGEGRSLLAAYNAFGAKNAEKSGKVWADKKDSSQSWKTAAEKWNWRARAEAWDAQQRKELEKRKARERLEKEQELDERLFQIRVQCVERIERMLDFPILAVTTESADGKHITVEPARWNQNSMVRLLEAVIKMGQQDETTITVKGKNLESGAVAFRAKGAEEYSDEELIAIAVAGGLRRTNTEEAENLLHCSQGEKTR